MEKLNKKFTFFDVVMVLFCCLMEKLNKKFTFFDVVMVSRLLFDGEIKQEIHVL